MFVRSLDHHWRHQHRSDGICRRCCQGFPPSVRQLRTASGGTGHCYVGHCGQQRQSCLRRCENNQITFCHNPLVVQPHWFLELFGCSVKHWGFFPFAFSLFPCFCGSGFRPFQATDQILFIHLFFPLFRVSAGDLALVNRPNTKRSPTKQPNQKSSFSLIFA